MELPLTPLEFARRTRKLHPAREAVVDGELRFTYEEFFARCDRWSAALLALGLRKNDRVAYIAPNTHAMLESFYSVPQIGAVLVPVNYRLTPKDFSYIINHSGARAVCADREYLEAIDSVRSQLTNVDFFIALAEANSGWLDYESLISAAAATFDRPAVAESDLLTINYTSGTTARPKGVMITHRNAYINVIGTLIHYPLTLTDRYLWTLPMFHANGWTFVWVVTAAAATHVCLTKVEPAVVFEKIRQESITTLCAAPAVLIRIANAPEGIRRGAARGLRILTAGAPPAAATIQRIEEDLGWVITQAYGLTETSPFITICEHRPEHDALSPAEKCSLKACQGVELMTSGDLRVVNEQGAEVAHDGNHLGEIVVRGNAVMEGYYRDPDATAAVMRDGWFYTGDAAVVHSNGYVEIRDRLKDIIISGGENISSVEVEGILLRHPSVEEAAVIGVPHQTWGEAPHAFVVLRSGAAATEQQLREFARKHLAHFKAPHGVTFVAELPKTATGKLKKNELRGGRSAIAKQ